MDGADYSASKSAPAPAEESLGEEALAVLAECSGEYRLFAGPGVGEGRESAGKGEDEDGRGGGGGRGDDAVQSATLDSRGWWQPSSSLSLSYTGRLRPVLNPTAAEVLFMTHFSK